MSGGAMGPQNEKNAPDGPVARRNLPPYLNRKWRATPEPVIGQTITVDTINSDPFR
jgi:hypothetical protein